MACKLKIPLALIILSLLLILIPPDVISEEPTACDRALFDCVVESGGWWVWQFACIIGWAWCVTYVEPFIN